MPEKKVEIKQKDFTPKYGKRIKHDLAEINKKKKAKYLCPKCNRKTVKWKGVGLWVCSKCDSKFASHAFEFKG